MSLESDLLRTFVAIADSGSITRAAEMQLRTQSAISMQMKKLEDVVAAQLLVRHARGVSLTAEGEQLVVQARRIIRLLDQSLEELKPEPLGGCVRVGIPEEFSATVLPKVLASFAEKHPAVEVTVRCESSTHLKKALSDGDLDMAVLVIDSGTVEGEILVHDPTVWVTSKDHFVHELDPMPVAMFEHGCWWRDWALKALEDRGVNFRIAYTSASVAGVQAAVSSGLAVAVLSKSMMPPGTHCLSDFDGFSSLPGSDIVLQKGQGAVNLEIQSLASVIVGAFRTTLPHSGIFNEIN